MLDDAITEKIIEKIRDLSQMGHRIVLVHGGGPFIEENLKMAGIESDFVEGHRRTTSEAMKYIEMALKGHVNSKLVRLLNGRGLKAVGLSGKDAGMVTVSRRMHQKEDGQSVDIGFVGDVQEVDVALPELMLSRHYIPVVSPVAAGSDGLDYNVNADMFAGHLAGALKADHFVMLTDVDGLMRDPGNPDSLIKTLSIGEEMKELYNDVIKGGMIPKTEACKIALENGARSALITNGTKPDSLIPGIQDANSVKGTVLKKS